MPTKQFQIYKPSSVDAIIHELGMLGRQPKKQTHTVFAQCQTDPQSWNKPDRNKIHRGVQCEYRSAWCPRVSLLLQRVSVHSNNGWRDAISTFPVKPVSLESLLPLLKPCAWQCRSGRHSDEQPASTNFDLTTRYCCWKEKQRPGED